VKKSTLAVHAGSKRETNMGGVNTPVYASTAIEYLDDSEVRYPRYFNTLNQKVVAAKLCALEGAEDGLVTSSGMAAISGIVHGLLRPGEHAVMLEGLYGGTHAMVVEEFRRLGIGFDFVNADPKSFRDAIRPETRLIFVESPTNPLLSMVDLEAIASLAREGGITAAIDNTFATPILQNPIRLGFDLVMHSGTKYLGGHSDLCCGAVVGREILIERIRHHAIMYGSSLNAQDCALLERSLKTLELRVRRQSRNATLIADSLLAHPAISRVHYPGIATHPGHDIAARQMEDFGAMLSFELAPEVDPLRFLRRLSLIPCVVSLGGLETTICQPVATSHAKMPREERERIGITPQLMRLSVGIDDPEDVMADLERGLIP
jgi:cystathionine beta-lyase